MPSTPIRDEANPHDIFVIEPDVVLATRAEHAAKSPAPKASQDQTPASLAPDIMADLLSRPATPKGRAAPDISAAAPVPPAAPMPPVETTFRATAATADVIASDIKASNASTTPDTIKVPDDIRLDRAPSSAGRWAKRAAVGFLFALGSVAAAEGWDHYGDTATQMTRQMMADWMPQFALNSSQPAEKPAPENAAAAVQPAAAASAPPAETPVQAAVADQTTPPPAPSAVQAAADAPATTSAAAAAPPQPAPAQSTSQDIAAMGQQIEALKASIAELKAGQEQMAQQMSQQIAQQASRDTIRNAVARTSDTRASQARMSEPRGRLSSTAPRPAPAVRKPPRSAYSAQASTAFNPPRQPAPPLPPPSVAGTPVPGQPQMQVVTEDGDLVVRPPMPVR